MTEAIVIPEDARSLAQILALAVGVPAGGRLELVYDANMRCVDAYIRPRSERRTASDLASTSIFCTCLIDTSTVGGLCIVCQRPKRPSTK